MKILIANGHLHVGGVEKSLVNLLNAIDYTRHQVDLLLFEDLGEYLHDIPVEVNVIFWDQTDTYGSVLSVLKKAIRAKKPELAFRKLIMTLSNRKGMGWMRLLAILRKHYISDDYDCAIAYRVGMPLDFVAYIVRARKKCAWWHHGSFDYDESVSSRWNDAFYQMRYLVCVSESSKKMIADHLPDHASKIKVIPNSVNLQEIQKSAEAFDPYSDYKNRTIIASVGRMSPEKHMIDSVFVLEKLIHAGYSNLLWCLVGDGSERMAIEKVIIEKNLDDYFYLAGNQCNPYPFIKNADLFVHPSRVESQGLSVLEAMALEKPTIVVHSSGTDEFVIDGYNAISADQSVDSIVNKVKSVISDVNSSQMKKGQKDTVQNYSMDKIASAFEELLLDD